jgi:hypothetical protein
MDLFKGTCEPLIDEIMLNSTRGAVIAEGEVQSGKSFSVFGVENI